MQMASGLDDLGHEEIVRWLARALQGREQLPQLTPDEAPHLGILRLDRILQPATRRSLRLGCIELCREFSDNLQGPTAYVQELLFLSSALELSEVVQGVAGLVKQFPRLPSLEQPIKLAILSALVDMKPPQSAEFWQEVLGQNCEEYSAAALSGLLIAAPLRAALLLGKMPDSDEFWEIAALKFDLTWDGLIPMQQASFVETIRTGLRSMGARFASAVTQWIESKNGGDGLSSNPSLSRALAKTLGGQSGPKVLTPKLCSLGRSHAA